jgi:hypothetical protein
MDAGAPVDYTQIVKRGLFHNGAFVQGLVLEAADGNPYDHDQSVLSSVKSGFFYEGKDADSFREHSLP